MEHVYCRLPIADWRFEDGGREVSFECCVFSFELEEIASLRSELQVTLFFKRTMKELRTDLLFCVFVCLGGADIELIHKAI